MKKISVLLLKERKIFIVSIFIMGAVCSKLVMAGDGLSSYPFNNFIKPQDCIETGIGCNGMLLDYTIYVHKYEDKDFSMQNQGLKDWMKNQDLQAFGTPQQAYERYEAAYEDATKRLKDLKDKITEYNRVHYKQLHGCSPDTIPENAHLHNKNQYNWDLAYNRLNRNMNLQKHYVKYLVNPIYYLGSPEEKVMRIYNEIKKLDHFIKTAFLKTLFDQNKKDNSDIIFDNDGLVRNNHICAEKYEVSNNKKDIYNNKFRARRSVEVKGNQEEVNSNTIRIDGNHISIKDNISRVANNFFGSLDDLAPEEKKQILEKRKRRRARLREKLRNMIFIRDKNS